MIRTIQSTQFLSRLRLNQLINNYKFEIIVSIIKTYHSVRFQSSNVVINPDSPSGVVHLYIEHLGYTVHLAYIVQWNIYSLIRV